jgi:outer membrane protein TolC
MARALMRLVGILIYVIAFRGSGEMPLHAQVATCGLSNRISLLEAIRSTLGNHPLLVSQKAQIQISEGLREQASGAFDLTLQSALTQDRQTIPLTSEQQVQNALIGLVGQSQVTKLTTYSAGLSKLFRSGVSVTPQFQLTRDVDNLFNASGVNSSSVGIQVSVPFLQGRGRKVVAAQEQAATREVEATEYDFNQLVAQLVANVATSYWNAVAASRNVAIANEAEDRGKAYRDNVQSLVEADHVPRNDLNEVTANLAQRASSRIAATQSMIAAQQQLALDMGISADHLFTNAPEPCEDFPDGQYQQAPSDTSGSMQYYFAQALRLRADYLASQRRISERKTLVTAAENRLQPQLNMNLSAGYSGLQVGRGPSDFFASASSGVLGPNASVGITYSFPIGNRSAHGTLDEAQGTARQAEVQSRELVRNISAAVVVALENVRNAILRVKKAGDSIQSYRAALEGEREKYRGGIGSIVDILTMEDRLTSALIDQVDAERVYALALIQFRFATGTLSAPDSPLRNLRADTFVTLPFTETPDTKP